MLYLTKKMLRDLWNMKTQFIAVFLMSFFAVFVYTGMEGGWYGMLDYSNELLERTNTSEAWVTGYLLDHDDVGKIEDIENIENVQAVASIIAEMEYDDGKYSQVYLMSSEVNEISKLVVMEGKAYTPTEDGIWLYQEFADEHAIHVDDDIELQYNEQTINLKVKGIVMSPEFLNYTGSGSSLTPDHLMYGYGYVASSTMESLTNQTISYNQLKIIYSKRWNSVKDEYEELSNDEIKRIRLEIEKSLEGKYTGYYDRFDFIGISSFTDRAKQIRSMTIIFSAILILLSILIIQTTMQRVVEIQRIQIGTLKAIGYKNWQIRLHYLFYGFWISLLGSILGYIVGPLSISEMILNLQKEFYSCPEWVIRNSWVSIAILIAVVMICSLTALIASGKATKGMPATTMRDQPPKTKKAIMLERFPSIWNLLSYEWRWTLREISRNKSRALIGIIGIAGSVLLLIDSFGLYNSLNYNNEYVYGTQYDYGAKINLKSTATVEEKLELLDLTNGDGQWLQQISSIEIRTSKERTNSMIQIYDDGYFCHFEDTDGNRISLPNDGIAISRKLAEDLQLQENDYIQIRIAGNKEYLNVKVMEIITASTPQGIFTSSTYWSEIGEDFSPNILLASDSSIVDEIVGYSYISEAITLTQQKNEANETLNSILMIIILLIVCALLLSITILYSLGILSFTEKSREYATLKVIGYKDKEIKSFIRHDNLLQLFIGIILGIPLGYAFLNFHITLASTSSFEYTAHLSPLLLILAILIIVITTLIISAIVASKAKKINMVEALKSVE